jgi:hypothetical protein
MQRKRLERVMTRTIKLSDNGGITFDTSGKLEMIGEANKISLPEVKQRTRIRFETQRILNVLHPYDGFDLYSIRKGSSDAKSMSLPISPETLINQEIRATLAQDPSIDWQNVEIIITNDGNRVYSARTRYGVKGSASKTMEYSGDLRML